MPTVVDGEARERQLSIYSTTDAREVAELLRDFRSLYPQISVEYADINSTELYSRFIAEVAAKEGTADLLWSSAMDLQIKLVNDGYAQAYASPEKPNLPPWAIWKNEAYGITAEPVVIVYNKRLVPAADVPRTRADLERLLTNNPAYRGKVAMMNPERSGRGVPVHHAGSAGDARYVAPGACDGDAPTCSCTPRSGAVLERVVFGRASDWVQHDRLVRVGARVTRSVDRRRPAT